MRNREKLPPNYDKLDLALRSIGYSFEDAIADIVDNSIDANAQKILIRLVLKPNGAPDVAIWDDGIGMDFTTLREAMVFGSDVTQDIKRLGKFGLGLKLASLGQAKSMTVISSKNDSVSGRAWAEDGIREGFYSDILELEDSKKLLDELLPGISWRKSGTAVIWENLFRLKGNIQDPNGYVQKLLKNLSDYLSLAFHRFLSGKARKVIILIDIFAPETGKTGVVKRLEPLDPFSYQNSGHPDFPAQMYLNDGYNDEVKVLAHIWPPNSTSPQYKLPGGANSRQGFYFYRNNRLIQGGGWNGLRDSDSHYSLARLEVDISEEFDLDINLNVKKVELHLPFELLIEFQNAATKNDLNLKTYLGLAQKAYRTITKKEEELPVVAGKGVPTQLQNIFRLEFTTKNSKSIREIALVWKNLPENRFFNLSLDNDEIVLNKKYRRQLLHGQPGSVNDLPVIKSILFLYFRELFFAERIGPKKIKAIEQLNKILLSAVMFEKEF